MDEPRRLKPSDDVLIVHVHRQLYGVCARTGEPFWQRSFPGMKKTSLGSRGTEELTVQRWQDRIVVTDGLRIGTYRYPDGGLIWLVSPPKTSGGPATLDINDARILMASGGELVCLDHEGTVRFCRRLTAKGTFRMGLAVSTAPDVSSNTDA